MFFYQSQGLGNDPQVTDSLILEFSAEIDSFGNNVWNTIWKKPGSPVHDFKKFVFVFSDTNYLNNKFQFRFRNLASVTGNFDHWNIDYVKLDYSFIAYVGIFLEKTNRNIEQYLKIFALILFFSIIDFE